MTNPMHPLVLDVTAFSGNRASAFKFHCTNGLPPGGGKMNFLNSNVCSFSRVLLPKTPEKQSGNLRDRESEWYQHPLLDAPARTASALPPTLGLVLLLLLGFLLLTQSQHTQPK